MSLPTRALNSWNVWKHVLNTIFAREVSFWLYSQVEEDTSLLRATLKNLVHQSSHLEDLLNDYTTEMVRAGGSELHVIATIVGGVASQEAIKLLTKQFCPLSGPLIYNGIACTSSVLNI